MYLFVNITVWSRAAATALHLNWARAWTLRGVCCVHNTCHKSCYKYTVVSWGSAHGRSFAAQPSKIENRQLCEGGARMVQLSPGSAYPGWKLVARGYQIDLYRPFTRPAWLQRKLHSHQKADQPVTSLPNASFRTTFVACSTCKSCAASKEHCKRGYECVFVKFAPSSVWSVSEWSQLCMWAQGTGPTCGSLCKNLA